MVFGIFFISNLQLPVFKTLTRKTQISKIGVAMPLNMHCSECAEVIKEPQFFKSTFWIFVIIGVRLEIEDVCSVNISVIGVFINF